METMPPSCIPKKKIKMASAKQKRVRGREVLLMFGQSGEQALFRIVNATYLL